MANAGSGARRRVKPGDFSVIGSNNKNFDTRGQGYNYMLNVVSCTLASSLAQRSVIGAHTLRLRRV